MKPSRLLLILLVAVCIIAWITRDHEVSPAVLLPFCSGGPPSLYDLAGVAMIIWTICAARRLLRGG